MKDRIAEGSRLVPAYRESVPDRFPAAAGVHQATISAAERTERIPGIDVLSSVCRALAVTPDLYSGGLGCCQWGGATAKEAGPGQNLMSVPTQRSPTVLSHLSAHWTKFGTTVPASETLKHH